MVSYLSPFPDWPHIASSVLAFVAATWITSLLIWGLLRTRSRGFVWLLAGVFVVIWMGDAGVTFARHTTVCAPLRKSIAYFGHYLMAAERLLFACGWFLVGLGVVHLVRKGTDSVKAGPDRPEAADGA